MQISCVGPIVHGGGGAGGRGYLSMSIKLRDNSELTNQGPRKSQRKDGQKLMAFQSGQFLASPVFIMVRDSNHINCVDYLTISLSINREQ